MKRVIVVLIAAFSLWFGVATAQEHESHGSKVVSTPQWESIKSLVGEWDGKPSCWTDTRWTGVLEKRDGAWVIVQMHFSFAKDPPPPKESTAGGKAD